MRNILKPGPSDAPLFRSGQPPRTIRNQTEGSSTNQPSTSTSAPLPAPLSKEEQKQQSELAAGRARAGRDNAVRTLSKSWKKAKENLKKTPDSLKDLKDLFKKGKNREGSSTSSASQENLGSVLPAPQAPPPLPTSGDIAAFSIEQKAPSSELTASQKDALGIPVAAPDNASSSAPSSSQPPRRSSAAVVGGMVNAQTIIEERKNRQISMVGAAASSAPRYAIGDEVDVRTLSPTLQRSLAPQLPIDIDRGRIVYEPFLYLDSAGVLHVMQNYIVIDSNNSSAPQDTTPTVAAQSAPNMVVIQAEPAYPVIDLNNTSEAPTIPPDATPAVPTTSTATTPEAPATTSVALTTSTATTPEAPTIPPATTAVDTTPPKHTRPILPPLVISPSGMLDVPATPVSVRRTSSGSLDIRPAPSSPRLDPALPNLSAPDAGYVPHIAIDMSGANYHPDDHDLLTPEERRAALREAPEGYTGTQATWTAMVDVIMEAFEAQQVPLAPGIQHIIKEKALWLIQRGETPEMVKEIIQKVEKYDKISIATKGSVKSAAFGAMTILQGYFPELSDTKEPGVLRSIHDFVKGLFNNVYAESFTGGLTAGLADVLSSKLVDPLLKDSLYQSNDYDLLLDALVRVLEGRKTNTSEDIKNVGVAFQTYTARNALRSVLSVGLRLGAPNAAPTVDMMVSAIGSLVAGSAAYLVMHGQAKERGLVGPANFFCGTKFEDLYLAAKELTFAEHLINGGKRLLPGTIGGVAAILPAARDMLTAKGIGLYGTLAAFFGAEAVAQTGIQEVVKAALIRSYGADYQYQDGIPAIVGSITNTILSAPIFAAWTSVAAGGSEALTAKANELVEQLRKHLYDPVGTERVKVKPPVNPATEIGGAGQIGLVNRTGGSTVGGTGTGSQGGSSVLRRRGSHVSHLTTATPPIGTPPSYSPDNILKEKDITEAKDDHVVIDMPFDDGGQGTSNKMQ